MNQAALANSMGLNQIIAGKDGEFISCDKAWQIVAVGLLARVAIFLSANLNRPLRIRERTS